MIEDTGFYSMKKGELARGCSLCVKGQKLVLFVTGLCAESCYYCPLSEQKKGKDVVYANERPVHSDKDIIGEARLMDARGAGFTGGDPLMKIERTVSYIRLLKKEFGSHFHIHLYTPLRLVDEEKLKALHEAGLDEIRFHPRIDKDDCWERINLAASYDWDVGCEIPAEPRLGGQTRKLLDYLDGKVKFLNINELEMSDTNSQELSRLGYCVKDEMSYGVSGSDELARELLEYSQAKGYAVHYCTTRLKDSVQMAERIKRTAKNAAKPFDKVTQEGLLIRGAVYIEGLEPGMDYHNKLMLADREKSLSELNDLRERLKKKLNLKDEQIKVDPRKLRVLTRAKTVKDSCRKIGNKCAVVEEYPTYDGFEVEVEMLN